MDLISDAVSLWDEMCTRGLEPRAEGRDEALLNKLKRELNLGNGDIRKELKKKGVKVEEFIYAFFSVTEPIAKMYTEIYGIMQQFGARSAKETILIKFDFSFPGGKFEFEMNKFRDSHEILRRLRELQSNWTSDDLHKLFRLFDIIRSGLTDDQNTRNIGYFRGMRLPGVPPFSGALYGVLTAVRDALGRVIEDVEAVPDMNYQNPLWRYYTTLTDLIPGFYGILSQSAETLASMEPHKAKEASDYFTDEISGMLQVKETEKTVKELIDLLNLPFWKFRWYLYEVWATMRTVDALGEFDISFNVDSAGTLTMDSGKMTEIATVNTDNGPLKLIAQLQTPSETPKGRKAVQPDLRICKDPVDDPANTMLVVELKQRRKMTTKYLSEIIAAYEKGCPNSMKDFFLSYDTLPSRLLALATARSSLIGDFNPSRPDLVGAYREEVLDSLVNSGYKPAKEFDAILFDISESMQSKYESAEVQDAIKMLLTKNRRSIVFLFNTQLIEPKDNDSTALAESLRKSSGNTDLEPCLTELLEMGGIRRILVITDGGYGSAPSLAKFEVVERQPTPEEFAKSHHSEEGGRR